ncbi:protocatechuate 3,4-dioxygenase [Ferruginivarius sediminum]|uniref:Intradiol ring-cleavage dioxygenase n=1 Tax=Ferruginivarius sediminum TaxID=2661937 RepID=A0A369TEZ1_9PROT|nr:protocatechuate 3,4-dioxygenase [Ferruginivarius sediminum]RDD63402.1 intradiol ring-cleavage dioxygenase [Ferruginivarius sediminum]
MHRRHLLAGGLGVAAAVTLHRAALAALVRTPAQTAGPFYPNRLPLDRDADLLRAGPDGGMAQGEPAEVFGRVLDLDGRPLTDMEVEIWQCDAQGYYHHIKEYTGGDPNFQGFGRTATGADGAYRFRTIKPVPYGSRTPHIHFRIRGRGTEGLTTQLYIRDHPMNGQDFVLARVPERLRPSVMADFKPEETGGPALARFDIVLGPAFVGD